MGQVLFSLIISSSPSLNINMVEKLSKKQDASTAITTSNIGSQSVNYASSSNYANSAGSAENATGNLANAINSKQNALVIATATITFDGNGYAYMYLPRNGYLIGLWTLASERGATYWRANGMNYYGLFQPYSANQTKTIEYCFIPV